VIIQQQPKNVNAQAKVKWVIQDLEGPLARPGHMVHQVNVDFQVSAEKKETLATLVWQVNVVSREILVTQACLELLEEMYLKLNAFKYWIFLGNKLFFYIWKKTKRDFEA